MRTFLGVRSASNFCNWAVMRESRQEALANLSARFDLLISNGPLIFTSGCNDIHGAEQFGLNGCHRGFDFA